MLDKTSELQWSNLGAGRDLILGCHSGHGRVLLCFSFQGESRVSTLSMCGKSVANGSIIQNKNKQRDV